MEEKNIITLNYNSISADFKLCQLELEDYELRSTHATLQTFFKFDHMVCSQE